MPRKKRDKTTVIFLNKGQNYQKPIQVHTHFLIHWKKLISFVIILFVGMAFFIFYLLKSREEIQLTKQQLAKQLEQQKRDLVALDTTSLRQQYLSIDSKLAKINKYLKVRGLKPNVKGLGGETSDKDLGTTQEIGNFYEAYLDKMLKLVGFTPMGYPHWGKISSTFGHRENPFSGSSVERHKGLDIQARTGESVKTTANGTVKLADWNGGYGKCVIISHGNGFETLYGHLSKITVKEGQQVKAGDVIGKVGSTGRSTGAHLHYEVHKNGNIINPKSYLNLE
jgi:murein DD-endopeptidase MepM/ murein hydrolase activator NlpD